MQLPGDTHARVRLNSLFCNSSVVLVLKVFWVSSTFCHLYY
jgi:hypothetical protein